MLIHLKAALQHANVHVRCKSSPMTLYICRFGKLQVSYLPCRLQNLKEECPSGLRRQFAKLLPTGSGVQIPSLPPFFREIAQQVRAAKICLV